MSEKPAVKMSTKSWHYKLMKLVLGSMSPTPQNMHNLCPYWWLLVFSVLVSPIVLPIKAIIWLISSISNKVGNFVMNQMILPTANSWVDSLSDFDLYQIYSHEKSINKSYVTAFGEYDDYYEKRMVDRTDFVIEQWEKRYNTKAYTDESNRWNRKFTKEFIAWEQEQLEAWAEYGKTQAEAESEKFEKSRKYEDMMEVFRDRVHSKLTSIKEYFSSWKTIIKWTKRFVGLVVTSVLLAATYFVVNFIGAGVLWLVEHWDWQHVIAVGLFLAIATLIVVMFYLLRSWVIYMRSKGTALWYVKVLYWIVTIIAWPLKIIFYRLLWQTILVNGWFFIVSAAKGFWRMILGFFGIFGEYFGASYTDYCPGIEWEENAKEDE